MKTYTYFLSNLAAHWKQWCETLPKFSMVECQFEFVQTATDAAGTRFTPTGQTPVAWLRERNREPWLYVNAAWPYANSVYGAPGREPASNVYWFRQAQTDAIARNEWWLMGMDKAGKRTPVLGSFGYPCPDMTEHAYLIWLLDHLLEQAPRRLRFDVAMIHRHGYFRPWTVGETPEQGDRDQMEGTWWLYDELRAAGVQVMANGGWEMADPEGAPWQFPALAHVDGVMVEWPNGFARWDSGRWWTLTEATLAGVAAAWRSAGKAVVLAAPYETAGYKKSTSASWEAHAQHWIAVARQLNVYLAMGRDDGDWSASSQTWWRPEYEDGQADDGPALPAVKTVEQILADHERRLLALEARDGT